ncbi:MAG: phosphoribosylanthranilate isomerase [Campylobacteraceae bacterium]|jgi:phosphoribosylanthranilate isomerase|nr:phosphoribosylanthranilate isomerase [Campylobacteraceae bacterium]
MRVKICGITNYEDAMLCVKSGADAVGFIFYPHSPRFISVNNAKNISIKLPPFITKTGVFVNESAQVINAVCKEAKIDLAQIHFDADDDLLSKLEVPFIRVVRAKEKKDIHKLASSYRLIDAFTQKYGGEGKGVDLSWFDGVDCSKIILAGGLYADMLEDIKRFGFYGVDVNSGVELSYGKKDAQKIVKFIKSAKS